MSDDPHNPLNGAVLMMLGEFQEGIRGIRSDLWIVYTRLAEGERRMDFLSEENIRRLKDIEAIVRARPGTPEPASSLARLGSAVWDCLVDLLSEKKDKLRWLILALLAWATNFMHLPPAWQETARSVIERSE